MNPPRRMWGLLVLSAALVVAIGCGGAVKEPGAPVTVYPAPPPPKDAAKLARSIVQATIGTTLRIDRLRDHPAGQRLARLGNVASLFEGTGVDLLQDANLAFVAATGITRDDKAIVIVKHTLGTIAVRGTIETVMERSDPKGHWLQGTKVPAARINVRNHERVVAIPDDSFLVVLPVQFADQVDAFEGPIQLETLKGPEAVVAVVHEPHASLRAQNAPPVPATVSRAKLTVTLRKDGGADVTGDGTSTTEEQAKADAAALTQSVNEATSARVAFVRIRFFKQIHFRSEGNHVKSDVHLSADELEKLLSMAEMMSNLR